MMTGREQSAASTSQEWPATPGAGRGQEGFSSTDFRGNVTLLTSGIQISHLQNWERMHFCCFKPPHVWYFVREALGNYYKGETNN